jgi:valyl-tRNA synthetase
MDFPTRYDAGAEPQIAAEWDRLGIYAFNPADPRPIYSIDTPPPTVSGAIHIGHVYSYVQAEAIARFQRMRGYNVYYPFGFDDNGLPTERFVERTRNIRARDVGRAAFIATCLDVSREVEDRFEAFWKRLGMSVDWRLRYSTIDDASRRISQQSFLELLAAGRIYRAQAPNPWCIECRTAIAQAEMDDVERDTTFYEIGFAIDTREQPPASFTLKVESESGYPVTPGSSTFNLQSSTLRIATTRPELLPACVAVFVHPEDGRYRELVGRAAVVPLSGRRVPILADASVDPQKGTGAVMCCTFGDTADVAWWRDHGLPLIPLIMRDGRLGDAGGDYAGLTIAAARARIIADLEAAGLLTDRRAVAQTVRVHERCGTPLEILETQQWFVRIADAREALLDAGRAIAWSPPYMLTRYEHWVANLSWDWCISRQRFFGVPFPVWHCDACGAIIPADAAQLPVDPLTAPPPRACACGNAELTPDADVMDTWATSSVSPQIAAERWAAVGGAEEAAALQRRLRPMQLRPQAHDIIRTWAFYTIVKEHFQHGRIPWERVMISGHALDPSGAKISKSKQNATIDPDALIARHGADAVRYWACSGALGADQPVTEETFRQGTRLVAKLWSAARFVGQATADAGAEAFNFQSSIFNLPWSDRALLSWLQRLVARTTEQLEAHAYNQALEATERFFWSVFCDHYLELVKSRLYDGDAAERAAALATLHRALLTILKLLAPVMPYVTDAIYTRLFAASDGAPSIHAAAWPAVDEGVIDLEAEQVGDALMAIAGGVRRFKSAERIGLGTPLAALPIAAAEPLRSRLAEAATDVRSITRAAQLAFTAPGEAGLTEVAPGLAIRCER